MKYLILILLLPLVASARLSDVDRAFIEHDNILENPSFVHGKAAWAISTGSFSVSGQGREAAVTWDAGATGETLCSSLVTAPGRFDRNNGLWSISVQSTTASTFKAYAYDGSNVLGEEVAVTASLGSYPVTTSGNFIFPASGSIQLCIESQADEPSISIFNAYLGPAANLTQVTPPASAIALITNTGSPVVTTDDQGMVASITDTGTGDVTINFTSGFFNVTPICKANGYINTPHRFCYISDDTPISTSGARVRCANDGGASVDESFSIECNKVGADAPINAVKADQTNRPWTAYTPTFTGFGTAANIDCQHRRQGQNAEIRCLSDSGTPTATEARVSLPGTHTSSSDLPATISVAGTYFRGATATSHGGAVLIEPSVAYITLSDSGAFSGTSVGALSKANGSNVVGTGETWGFKASVQIQGWEETMNAPLIKHSVVTTAASVYGIESASVSTAGSVSKESGDWISGSCTNANPMVCTLNAGIFSSTPTCVTSVAQTGTSSSCHATASSATSVSLTCNNDTGAASVQSVAKDLICHGPR